MLHHVSDGGNTRFVCDGARVVAYPEITLSITVLLPVAQVVISGLTVTRPKPLISSGPLWVEGYGVRPPTVPMGEELRMLGRYGGAAIGQHAFPRVLHLRHHRRHQAR